MGDGFEFKWREIDILRDIRPPFFLFFFFLHLIPLCLADPLGMKRLRPI